MLNITVYLPEEIGTWAKKADLNLSYMLRRAVEGEQHRQAVRMNLGDQSGVHELEVQDKHKRIYTARFHGRLLTEHDGVTAYLSDDGNIWTYDGSSFDLCPHDEPWLDLQDWPLDDYLTVMEAIGVTGVVEIGKRKGIVP